MLSIRPAGLPIDAERGVSTRTPGRALSKTRNVLQENAARNVPMTVMGKGRKLVQNTPLQSRTLQIDRVLKDASGKQIGPSKLKDTLAIRPLGDKTPFPNRTANQLSISDAKTPKPALPDGLLRPSSARKHDRLPRSASKAFETPITDGKHWDVSDIEIEVDASVANQTVHEESYDEVEYMPPKVEDIPYEPSFEMPDYREVGKTLMALIRSYPLEDDPPANLTFTVDASESNFFTPPTLPQREIEDDGPFARAKPEPEVKLKPPTVLKQKSAVTSKLTPCPALQRTAPTTRTTTTTNSRTPSTVRRPPTTSSARRTTNTARTSSSQSVTRIPMSQSTLHARTSRAPTRTPPSVARSTPLVRASGAEPCRATSVSRPTTKAPVRPVLSTVRVKNKTVALRPNVAPAAKIPAPLSNVSLKTGRPRSGTITKEAFESNMHVAIHIRNHSFEDVKKDLEGLIVFEDAFDEDDGFRFDV